MNRDLITCRPGDEIKYCAKIMLEKKINAVPIVNKDQMPVGIVTSTDLLKSFNQDLIIFSRQ